MVSDVMKPCESCMNAGYRESEGRQRLYCEYKRRFVDDRSGNCSHKRPLPKVYQIELGCCGRCARCFIEEVRYDYFVTIDGTCLAIPEGKEPPTIVCTREEGRLSECRMRENCEDFLESESSGNPYEGNGSGEDPITYDDGGMS